MSDSRVDIEEEDGEFKITMPFDEDAKTALKEKFQAYWNPDERVWCIDSDTYTIRDVEGELKLHFPRAFR